MIVISVEESSRSPSKAVEMPSNIICNGIDIYRCSMIICGLCTRSDRSDYIRFIRWKPRKIKCLKDVIDGDDFRFLLLDIYPLKVGSCQVRIAFLNILKVNFKIQNEVW